MKRKIAFLFSLFFILTAFAVFINARADTVSSADYNEIKQYLEFKNIEEQGAKAKKANIANFPLSVTIIEDEAFAGTSITSIALPETVTMIGDRAFANIYSLRSIRIPQTVTSIAKTAFVGSDHVIISAVSDSYAQKWANENKVPFVPITLVYASTEIVGVSASSDFRSKEIVDTEYIETKEINKDWRKLEEIHIIGYIEIMAYHVQGRSPPMP